MGPGLDRARRDAEQAGDLGLGQVEVVAQDDDGPLAGRQSLEGLPQDQVVAAEVGLVAVLGAAGDQVTGSTTARRSRERCRLSSTLRA